MSARRSHIIREILIHRIVSKVLDENWFGQVSDGRLVVIGRIIGMDLGWQKHSVNVGARYADPQAIINNDCIFEQHRSFLRRRQRIQTRIFRLRSNLSYCLVFNY